MSTNKINIEAVNARAKEAQTPMTNQTIEQAVEEIVNKASDCAYGMNLDISGKESKRMMDEFSRSTWFKGELTQALQAQRDAGVEKALVAVRRKANLIYQDQLYVSMSDIEDVEKALTPPTN